MEIRSTEDTGYNRGADWGPSGSVPRGIGSVVNIEIKSDILFHSFGTEGILLDQTGETYFSLNETGVRMWELLTSGLSTSEISETIAQEFDAPVDQIVEDVDAFVTQLGQRGIVQTNRDDA